MILLAGGTGHLGRPLTELLAARGPGVRVLSRDPSGAHARVPSGIELVAGDVRVASSLKAALVDVRTVISAVTGFGPGGGGPRQVDMEGNQNLIAAAVAAGVDNFVLVSIHGASFAHSLELYRAKFIAEQTLQESNLAWTIVRPTPFMELWAGIIGDSLIKGGAATVFGHGKNPINFVSVRDVARFIDLAAADRQLRGKTLDVGGPENLTLSTVVEVIAASHGLRPRTRHVPLPALRLAKVLLRPFRPDLASLIQASIQMDTCDMSFDQATLTKAYPEIRLTRFGDIVHAPHGESVAA